MIVLPYLTDKVANRFWSKVQIAPPNECWEWMAGLKDNRVFRNRYGAFRVNSHINIRSHQVAYIFANQCDIPDGMVVCHTCDNPKCCNPSHLWLGTNTDNMRDAALKSRLKIPNNSGEKHGMSMLLEDDVRKIKFAPQYWGIGRDLALRFGVSPQTVAMIRSGKRWSHVI